MKNPPCILTIAGSDCSGGAGIQADHKTIAANGGYGLSVITALTAQNTTGVKDIFAPPPEFVVAQMQAVLEDIPVAAAKTGMLFSEPIISALAPLLAKCDFPLVVDPVCVSQSGHRLLRENAVNALKEKILPLASLVTPNRPEAELLAGMPITCPQDVQKASEKILGLGPLAVLIKGGHFDGPEMIDWLAIPGQSPKALPHTRIASSNLHGTGCTLSAAIATFLGHGESLVGAIMAGQNFLHRAIETSYDLGKGSGPVNHLCALAAK